MLWSLSYSPPSLENWMCFANPVTFNYSWIQLHKILQFGLFVVILDPLKIFQNLFVQMLHATFTANQKFFHTFPMGSLRNAWCVTALSWTCTGLKSHMSVVNAFTVIISHLVAWKVACFEKKKSTLNFLLFSRIQLNLYILNNICDWICENLT